MILSYLHGYITTVVLLKIILLSIISIPYLKNVLVIKTLNHQNPSTQRIRFFEQALTELEFLKNKIEEVGGDSNHKELIVERFNKYINENAPLYLNESDRDNPLKELAIMALKGSDQGIISE
jgi:hypothetical protein